MNKNEALHKLRSIALSISVHPDNQDNSEFSDQLSSLEEVIEWLDESAPVDEKPEAQYNPETAKATYPKYPHITGEIVPAAPVDDVVDVAVNVMNDFLQDQPNNGKLFSISNIRSIFRLLNEEEISFSRFVELLNERSSRQPEVDALKKRVDELEGQCEVLKLTLINHKCNNH